MQIVHHMKFVQLQQDTILEAGLKISEKFSLFYPF